MLKTVLITVGTTKYDELLKEINKKEFFQALVKIGCQDLIIQYGCTVLPEDFPKNKYILNDNKTINIQSYKFKFDNNEINSFKNDMLKSDLIISHAGIYNY